MTYAEIWKERADARSKGSAKVTAVEAGYMELDGAKKDAGCEVVSVVGGVSSDLGCCNLFRPGQGVKKFTCGTCKHVT